MPTPEGAQAGVSVDKNRAAELARQADELCNAGAFARGIDLYSQALRHDPGAAEVYHGRGQARLALGDNGQAEEDFSAAIRLSPGNTYYYGSRSLVRYARGDYAGVVADTSRAIELGAGLPADSLAKLHYSRGMARRALGDEKGAGADFAAGRGYDPEGRFDPRDR
jgi:tetratricopeptide (TPR) repeat protein